MEPNAYFKSDLNADLSWKDIIISTKRWPTMKQKAGNVLLFSSVIRLRGSDSCYW